MAPVRKEDSEKENQGIHTLVENIIEKIVPDLIERILAKSVPQRITSAGDGITKKANQFVKIVGNFDGKKDGYDYLCTAEAMFITMDIDEEEKTTYVCCTFVSSAARWLLNNEGYRKLTWKEFRCQFERQFCTKNAGQTDLMRLMRLRKNGTMEEHIDKCAQLRRGIPKEIPEKELILIFIQTLEEEEQAILATMDPASLDDAFSKALKFNTFRPVRRSNNCLALRTDSQMTDWDSQRTDWDRQRPSFNQPNTYSKHSWRNSCAQPHRGTQNYQTIETGPQCYNCGRQGHVSRHCRDARQKPRWNDRRPLNGNPLAPLHRSENYRTRILCQQGEYPSMNADTNQPPNSNVQDDSVQDFREPSH